MRAVDLLALAERAEVRALLACAVGYATTDKLDRVLRQYADDPSRRLIGFEQSGTLNGLLGFEVHQVASAVFHHVAVRPSARGRGLGRAMIGWLVDTAGMTRLTAETDRATVRFFERLGFKTIDLGERYPGTERFRCDLDAHPTRPAGATGARHDEQRREQS